MNVSLLFGCWCRVGVYVCVRLCHCVCASSYKPPCTASVLKKCPLASSGLLPSWSLCKLHAKEQCVSRTVQMHCLLVGTHYTHSHVQTHRPRKSPLVVSFVLLFALILCVSFHMCVCVFVCVRVCAGEPHHTK